MDKIIIDSNYIENNINSNYIKTLLKDESFNIEFQYISDFSNSKQIRDSFGIMSDILSIPALWKNRIILILDELVNNSIEYGSAKNETNFLRINIKKNENIFNINIEAEDCGNGAKRAKAVDMENLREKKLKIGFDDHFSIRGRGLFMIITKLVERLYFKDSEKGGLIVGIDKEIIQSRDSLYKNNFILFLKKFKI